MTTHHSTETAVRMVEVRENGHPIYHGGLCHGQVCDDDGGE